MVLLYNDHDIQTSHEMSLGFWRQVEEGDLFTRKGRYHVVEHEDGLLHVLVLNVRMVALVALFEHEAWFQL